MRVSLIIAAGGLGKRFWDSVSSVEREKFSKKLFRHSEKVMSRSKICLLLDGKPLVSYSLPVFRSFKEIQEIIFAVPPGSEGKFSAVLAMEKGPRIKVVRGGRTRAESVWNALKKTSPSSEWVMVHDGARPLIAREWIREVLSAVKSKKIGGAILGRKVVPTIKKADAYGLIETTLDRSVLYEAETPQLARRKLLLRAYADRRNAFRATDEASLLESIGERVKVVCHDGWNPKITSSEDYRLVCAYQESGRNKMIRTGFGRDTHRLVTGRLFYLGGIVIPYDKGPLGHSDGDALLHAVTDAVLGATGRGDIGDWFSDQDPKNKGINSSKILRTVLEDTKKHGWQVEHVDTIVILEKPKLGKYKEWIRKHIANLIGIAEDAVSVKAKTQEGLGPEGEGLAVTCEALVTMRGGLS